MSTVSQFPRVPSADHNVCEEASLGGSLWNGEGTMEFLKKLFQKKTKVAKVDIAKRFDLIVRT